MAYTNHTLKHSYLNDFTSDTKWHELKKLSHTYSQFVIKKERKESVFEKNVSGITRTPI
jgi:hypothetical protein